MVFTRRRARAPIVAALLVGVGMSGCSGAGASTTGDVASGTGAPETSVTATGGAVGMRVDVSAALAGLEERYAARIGVSATDTGTGRSVAYRSEERFGYASTLKVLAAA